MNHQKSRYSGSHPSLRDLRCEEYAINLIRYTHFQTRTAVVKEVGRRFELLMAIIGAWSRAIILRRLWSRQLLSVTRDVAR